MLGRKSIRRLLSLNGWSGRRWHSHSTGAVHPAATRYVQQPDTMHAVTLSLDETNSRSSPTVTIAYETDIKAPRPRSNEVLVRTVAAGVSPLDVRMYASGYGRAFYRDRPAPNVALGREFSGVVEKVGANVFDRKVGDEVVGVVELTTPGGAFADYVAVAETLCVPKPAELSFVDAAAVPYGAMTAEQSLDTLRLVSGQCVLVHGASGSVGLAAVGLAKARGCHVLATSDPKHHDRLRALGAATVFDSRNSDELYAIPFQVDRPIDAVLDCVRDDLSEKLTLTLLSSGGRVAVLHSRLVEEFDVNGPAAFAAAKMQLEKFIATTKAERNIDWSAVILSATKERLERVMRAAGDSLIVPNVVDIEPLRNVETILDARRDGSTSDKAVLLPNHHAD